MDPTWVSPVNVTIGVTAQPGVFCYTLKGLSSPIADDKKGVGGTTTSLNVHSGGLIIAASTTGAAGSISSWTSPMIFDRFSGGVNVMDSEAHAQLLPAGNVTVKANWNSGASFVIAAATFH
jgi:hypothetical protein